MLTAFQATGRESLVVCGGEIGCSEAVLLNLNHYQKNLEVGVLGSLSR